MKLIITFNPYTLHCFEAVNHLIGCFFCSMSSFAHSIRTRLTISLIMSSLIGITVSFSFIAFFFTINSDGSFFLQIQTIVLFLQTTICVSRKPMERWAALFGGSLILFRWPAILGWSHQHNLFPRQTIRRFLYIFLHQHIFQNYRVLPF